MTMSAPRAGLPPALVDDVDDVLRRIDALVAELGGTRPSDTARSAEQTLLPPPTDHLLTAFDPDADTADTADVLIRVYADLAGVLDTLRHQIHRLTAGAAHPDATL